MAREHYLTKFRTEFNMGALDFQRHHYLLTWMDFYNVRVRCKEIKAMKQLFSYAYAYYDNIFNFCNQKERKELDKMFKAVEDIISGGITEEEAIILSKKLPEIVKKLHITRNNHNLGIPFNIQKSESRIAKDSLMMRKK